MGNCVSGFKRQTSSTVGIKQREIFIAVVGVDDAGKTTVIKALNGDSLDGVLPTVGFNRFDLKFKKLKITVYDLGGDVRIRDIWSSYYAEIFGIIYVINAAEQRRMTENKTLLLNMIKDVNMQGKPILLLLNKQDKPGALDEVDAAEQLDLSNAVNRYKSPCRIETCSALKGTGKDCDPPMRHGFNWLLEQIENKYSEMEARVTAAVTELKARQAKERQERMARIRAKQEAEEAAEANAEQETSIDATSAALENGSAKHFRNRVLPFEPLPQIKEEGNNTSPYRDPFLSTSSAQLNGGRKNSRTSSSSLGVGQVPHLPPISPPQSLQRRLPSMNNLSVTASVVPISAHSSDQMSIASSMDRHSSDDSAMQRGETRRKRKNKRLGRLQQVGPSGSQENSPPNSESSEVLHVRPARPAKLSVIRQHASIPEDDEILEELPSIQVRSGWANQQKAHSPVSERKESQDSYAQSQRRQSQDSYAQSQRRQSEDSYAQSQQRRQSIRSQDLSDAPSTIHSIKDEEDQHSRHVRFKSPQVSARSIASMRHSTVSNDHSRENGAKQSPFPSLTQREQFFQEINERRYPSVD